MIGLLVIAAYAIFWIICLILAVWISKISKKHRFIVGVLVFFTISPAPYYYYLYDKAMYDQACQNAEMFFPETPYEKPEILYIYEYDHQRKPPGYYTDGYIFDYIVSLPSINNRNIINNEGMVEAEQSPIIGVKTIYELTPKIVRQYWDKLEVFDHQKNKLEGNIRSEILKNLRYGFFLDPFTANDSSTNIRINKKYIYDFEKGKEISVVTTITHSRSVDSDTINYLWGWRFRYCLYGEELLERRDVGHKYLLEKTFDLKE